MSLKQAKASLQFLFSGTFGQFNIFVFVALLFLAFMFPIVNRISISAVVIWGNIILALLAISVFGCALVIYLRKTPRTAILRLRLPCMLKFKAHN